MSKLPDRSANFCGLVYLSLESLCNALLLGDSANLNILKRGNNHNSCFAIVTSVLDHVAHAGSADILSAVFITINVRAGKMPALPACTPSCIEILRIKTPLRGLCRRYAVALMWQQQRSFALRAHCGRDARGPKRRELNSRNARLRSKQFAVNRRDTFHVNLRLTIVRKQPVNFLFNIRQLRITEPGEKLQTRDAQHQVAITL
jgi:hypothetical protein